ncbi:MAG: quinone-dependent dihydroorotate dehydrogenase [Opitutales bacterium]
MGLFYEKLLRPILFRMEPERAHERALGGLKLLKRLGPLTRLQEQANLIQGDRPIECFGLQFPNVVGLAAGWDKNGEIWPVASALGFGHVEIGTVTHQAQPGNPRPRLFRYARDEALINRMGFNNNGAETLAKTLSRQPAKGRRRIPLGINIGKSKAVSLEQAAEDYCASFTLLADHADYVTINVSSPNTPNLRRLQAPGQLDNLLGAIGKARSEHASKQGTPPVPMLVKVSPDESYRQINAIIEAVQKHALSGIIATNTTLARPGRFSEVEEAGGLSGQPLHLRAVQVVNYIYKHTEGTLPIIGSGGITNLEAAGRFIDAGASLVQVYTGMIYRGPFFAREVARSLIWHQRAWL